MDIEETIKKIQIIVNSNKELSHLFGDLKGALVYSTSCPLKFGIKLDYCPTTIVFHNEDYHCFQLVTFQLSRTDEYHERIQIRISVIAEVYLLSSGISTTLLVTPNTDPRLNITYLKPYDGKCDQFCVELDLERITRDFPRLVERVYDAIVFLGEVLLVGEYS